EGSDSNILPLFSAVIAQKNQPRSFAPSRGKFCSERRLADIPLAVELAPIDGGAVGGQGLLVGGGFGGVALLEFRLGRQALEKSRRGSALHVLDLVGGVGLPGVGAIRDPVAGGLFEVLAL